MKEIELTQGYKTQVDDDTYTILYALKWHAHVMDYTVYARRWSGNTIMWMHNVVCPPVEGLTVDHIDGDGLNNQRSNLRLVTESQQQINRRSWNPIAKGVYQNDYGRWQARISIGGKRISLGYFDTQEEAAEAYAAAASRLHGPFVRNEKEPVDQGPTG
jgi:hypothetical protein